MKFFVIRLDNIILGNDCITLEDSKELKVLIANSNQKIIIGGIDILPQIFNANLCESIGTIRFDTLKQHPFMIFAMASDEWDSIPHTKDEYDKKYTGIAYAFQMLALCFSLGTWLVKDSCVEAGKSYWINGFNEYVSMYTTGYQPTKSSGILETDTFSEAEIRQAHGYSDELAPFLFDFTSHIPLPQKEHGGTTYISQEKAAGLFGVNGKSFIRALLKVQESRRAGDISSKIEYACSALEALFAISERHRYNLKTLTAGYIGESDADKSRIKNLIDAAYGIRSDHSHGDYIQYLSSNGLDSLEQVSKDLDDILRKTFRKILKQPELNYSSERADIDRVRQYWDSIRAE